MIVPLIVPNVAPGAKATSNTQVDPAPMTVLPVKLQAGLSPMFESTNVAGALDTRLVNVIDTVSTFLRVTLVLALVVLIFLALIATGLGVNDVPEPSPDTFRESPMLPCPSFGNVVFTVPAAGPVTVGSKTTLKEHDAPAATTVEAVMLQIGAVRPVVLTLKPALATGLVIVNEPLLLLFVKVTLVAAELTPFVCDAKWIGLGVNVS